MRPKLFIFRPGTLGDQLVLLGILKDTNLSSTHDIFLIERNIKNRVSALSFEYFHDYYTNILSYKSFLHLFKILVTIKFKYSKITFLYIPHSARSIKKVLSENLFFGLFFGIRYKNIRTFLYYTNNYFKFVPEYDRIMYNIEAVFPDIHFAKKQLVSGINKKVVIAPRSAWSSKDWSVERFRQLIKKLALQGFQIVLVGTSADRLEDFVVFEDRVVRENTRLMTDYPLDKVESVLVSSKLFIGVDSAISHLAAACGVPSIILFSDTNRAENWCPPYSHVKGIRKSVECGGCFSAKCLAAEHICMSSISFEEVSDAIFEKLTK